MKALPVPLPCSADCRTVLAQGMALGASGIAVHPSAKVFADLFARGSFLLRPVQER
ncbi:hypothetical protein [Propionivibrio sp.]|uniref:hypothetical protein n=1 Tax=Propionivibrio sp. TaxID=2212460 RepID=UPI003BF3718E